MSASFYIGTIGFDLISLSLVIIIMPPNRSSSKEIIERNTGEVVESTPITMLILSDTQLFIEKDSDIGWHTIKDAFTTTNFKGCRGQTIATMKINGQNNTHRNKSDLSDKKTIKSDTCKTYLETHCKLSQNILDLVWKARAPISNVKMSSKSVYYIYLFPTWLG